MTDTLQSLAELHEKLDRLHNTVESAKRRPWVDYVCAVLLSLATVGSAWCAYQSARWSGVQTFRLAAANSAGREAAAHHADVTMWVTFDAQMFLNYVESKERGDAKFADFLYERFRPEARAAVDAWLKMNPLKDPAAPKHPFQMQEYDPRDRKAAAKATEESARFFQLASAANVSSDSYTLLTVLFASVLFFAGISGTLQSRMLRAIFIVLAIVLFTGTMVVLVDLPFCRE
jgi:hypothetical protein